MIPEKLGACPWCGEVKGWSYDAQRCGNCDYDRLAPAASHLRLSIAAADVLTERRRQVDIEGWTAGHDDAHREEDLARAAVAYAAPDWLRQFFDANDIRIWPWHWQWWKPKDRRRDLVRAAALIIAEIERLDRAENTGGES